MERCSLCGYETRRIADPRSGRSYHRCRRCDLIGLDAPFLPSEEAERSRYLLHTNSEHDSGYVRFLSEFVEEAVMPASLTVAARSGGHPLRMLDFGSGPVPVLASMLGGRGFEVAVYDPYFAPDRSALSGAYDMVVMHEVIEHIAEAGPLLVAAAGLIASGGALVVRSRLHPASDGEFLAWWYREDETHIRFYSTRTFQWIGEGSDFELADSNGVDMVRLRRRV
jgi:hypothetical protein